MADESIAPSKAARKEVSIYALVDPRNNAIRYVGKSDNPGLRLRLHLQEAKRNQSPKSMWLRELIATAAKPKVLILERVAVTGNWHDAEDRHIAGIRAAGAVLLNRIGGRRSSAVGSLDIGAFEVFEKKPWPRPLSDAHKQAIGAALRGRKISEEQKIKLRAAVKLTPERLANLRKGAEAARGRVPTAESNEKRRRAQLARLEEDVAHMKHNWSDPEIRERLMAKRVNRKLSAEHKANVGKASARQWRDPEIRQRRTAGLRRAMNAPEYRAHRKDQMKKRWADPALRAAMLEAQKKARKQRRLSASRHEASHSPSEQSQKPTSVP